MILETILGALLPVGVEGIKQVVEMFTGGKKVSVDDQIRLDQNEIAKMQAMAALDNPYGTPSQWVVNLRASSRYLGALFIITSGIGIQFIDGLPIQVKLSSLEAANIAFGFLFGSRITFNLKK